MPSLVIVPTHSPSGEPVGDVGLQASSARQAPIASDDRNQRLADAFTVDRDALVSAFWDVRWHALATALMAPPVWTLTDRFFAALRIDGRRPEQTQWVGR